MKKHIYLAAVAAMLLASCSNSLDPTSGVEYYPVQLEKNSSWSMIGSDGKLLFEDEFKNQPTAVIDGMFTVEEGNGWSLYEASAKPKAILEDLVEVGFVSEGLIGVVHPGERIQFVNKSGKTQFTLDPIDNKEITACCPAFFDDVTIVIDEDNKYGAVNTKGDVVIKPKYDYLGFFNEGLAFAMTENEDGEETYRVIDKKGTEVFKIKNGIEPYAPSFSNGRLLARQDEERYGFLNKKGEFTKLPEKVHGVSDFNDKFIIYIDADGNSGIMNIDGEVIVRAKYDHISMIDDGDSFLATLRDEKFDILDSKGEKVESLDFENVQVLKGKGFCMIAKDGSTMMLIDKKGKQVGKTEFVDINQSFTSIGKLHSDYFPTQAVVNQIASIITPDSIDKYKLGESAEKALEGTSPNDYAYRSVKSFDNVIESKYFSSALYLNFSNSIAEMSMNAYNIMAYSYGSYDFMYQWNTNSTIDNMELYIYTTKGRWNDLSAALAKALQEKGFKKSAESTDSQLCFEASNSSLELKKIEDTSLCITLRIGKDAIPTEEVEEVAATDEYYDYDEVAEAVAE